ncbi:MAG: UDP-N-acetylmuramate:L-alanyl-gamma-D-glutamyl-meso-diaminopimelate ligase [Acidobacteria bacterium]|nr:UDP-N-acetylmuramate:L-alanyl-gamma-D-glutamyl-meso-diaminopimelate ligase [Acidobacteriota bacterium]
MDKKHFHLIGVCGTAMGSLAGMLKTQGHRVTGSDKAFYPPMGDELKRLGIETYQGFSADHLKPAPDVVVVGNATSRGNAELEYVLNHKLRYASMPEVIRENFIRGRHSTVVAGTHGKTTTTSILAWVMEVGGLDPSFLIGGVAENFGASFKVTSSKYFAIEGDEYDTAYFDKGPKFLHYLPDLVILNNIEYDHADIYPDLDAVKKSFRLLVNLIPSDGRLIAGWDSPVVREIVENPISPQGVWCGIETFGIDHSDAKWTAGDIVFKPEETRFKVFCEGREYGEIRTPLAGMFNVRNCLAVIAASEILGIERNAVSEALATFKSVKRRMQVRGTVNQVTVIDDFAHHPTAIRETLLAVKQKYPDRRIVAIFEPRSWTTRKKIFQHDYPLSFAPAEYVVIAPIFESFRLAADDQLSVDEVISDLAKQGKQAWSIEGADAIVEHLAPILLPGDVVVVMSNGGFGGIHQKLLEALGGHESGSGITKHPK